MRNVKLNISGEWTVLRPITRTNRKLNGRIGNWKPEGWNVVNWLLLWDASELSAWVWSSPSFLSAPLGQSRLSSVFSHFITFGINYKHILGVSQCRVCSLHRDCVQIEAVFTFPREREIRPNNDYWFCCDHKHQTSPGRRHERRPVIFPVGRTKYLWTKESFVQMKLGSTNTQTEL